MSTPNPNERDTRPLEWSEIENRIMDLVSVEGGNSNAQRGIMTAPDGRKVFVKIGVNEHTRGWATKEINSYRFLDENSYPFIPKLLSVNQDKTGFAIEALLPENGWDWSATWSKERLDATLVAMDALAAIQPDSKYVEMLRPVITDADNGWVKLVESEERRKSLATKLETTPYADLMNDIDSHVQRSSDFVVRHDMLVHDDVRADNCPWNKDRGEVKFVDWNWLELGDRRIDLAASLTHIHKSGFDVLQNHSDRLDPEALHWITGFWLNAASQPIWPGGPEKLRDTQLQAGLTALQLIKELKR